MFNPVSWFSGLPHEWAIFFLSMIPLTELRASIPIGIEAFGMPVWKVWIITVVGDFIPALFILAIAPRIHAWIIKTRLLGKFATKMLERAEGRFAGKYARYGALGLVVFVGIPLPLTGSWSGSLAAFVFNIPFKKSWPLILAGVCVAATLVTVITLFAGGIIRSLFI